MLTKNHKVWGSNFMPKSLTLKKILVVPSAWRLINGLKIDDLLKANDMKIMENINIDLINPHYRKQ